LGTLFPQSNATMNLFSTQALPGGLDFIVKLIEALIILLGTLTTLIYFQFRARPKLNQPPRRSPVVEGLAWVGQIFIAIALGALFAGVYTAALTALVERSQFVVTLVLSLIKP
jgi:heme/copper-type cytochrome/quinol oxidase subunit 2